MTKLITSKDKVVIKLEMDRLLATPPILLEGQKQVLGKTLSAMIAQIAWRYIGSKKPGFFTGRTLTKTTVELVGGEMVVTFTGSLGELAKTQERHAGQTQET